MHVECGYYVDYYFYFIFLRSKNYVKGFEFSNVKSCNFIWHFGSIYSCTTIQLADKTESDASLESFWDSCTVTGSLTMTEFEFSSDFTEIFSNSIIKLQ